MARVGKPVYIPFYPDDFLSDEHVAQMSTTEIGAYVLLLLYAWKSDPPATIPDDDQALRVFTKMSHRSWKRARHKVLAPWVTSPDHPGRLVQPRLAKEWDHAVSIVNQRREAGRKGGIASAKVKRRSSGATANVQQSSSIPGPGTGKERERELSPPVVRPTGGRRLPADMTDYERAAAVITGMWPKNRWTKPRQDEQAVIVALLVLEDRGETNPAQFLIDRAREYLDANKDAEARVACRTWCADGMYDVNPAQYESTSRGWLGEEPKP